MNTIEEYYELAENEIQDRFAVASTLLDVANKSKPETAINLLIESEILNNCTYRKGEFVFWPTISRYKFDILGFTKLEDLNLAVVSYLKARLMITKNPLLQAKYHHALWHSSVQDKHIHGRQAIENYIAHISSCIKKSCTDKECGNLIDHLRNLDALSITLKHKTEDLQTILSQIVQNRNSLPTWFVFYTLGIIYPKRNQLTKEFNEECFLALQECFEKEDLDSIKESIYAVALKYGTFLKIPVLNWHDLMGHYYFSLASNRAQTKGDFLIPEYYARAINFFSLSGNTDMHSKLSSDFQKVKAGHELPTVPFSIPIPKEHSDLILSHRELIKKHVENLNAEELILFISYSENLIPHRNVPETKIPFLDYAQGSFYDRNKNFTHTSSGSLINSKSLEIQLFIIDALKDTFKHSIDTNKLTADIFIEHLENKSWVGQNESSKYWAILLKPGITKFFTLYKNYVSGNSIDLDELIMTFDTLTIKIEGLLRTYGELNSVNITKIISEKSTGGKNVETREALMNELFSDEHLAFKGLFEEKEYEFLKYLYLKGGLNIRNDIAHSFYKPDNYSLEKLLLVVLSIFRISHFKIKAK